MNLQINPEIKKKFEIWREKENVVNLGKNKEKTCSKCLRKLSIENFYDRLRKDRPGKKYKVSACKECCVIQSVKLMRRSRAKKRDEVVKK